jgi:hypothetical protein
MRRLALVHSSEAGGGCGRRHEAGRPLAALPCRATENAHRLNAGIASRLGAAVHGVHGDQMCHGRLEAAPAVAVHGVHGVHGKFPPRRRAGARTCVGVRACACA